MTLIQLGTVSVFFQTPKRPCSFHLIQATHALVSPSDLLMKSSPDHTIFDSSENAVNHVTSFESWSSKKVLSKLRSSFFGRIVARLVNHTHKKNHFFAMLYSLIQMQTSFAWVAFLWNGSGSTVQPFVYAEENFKLCGHRDASYMHQCQSTNSHCMPVVSLCSNACLTSHCILQQIKPVVHWIDCPCIAAGSIIWRVLRSYPAWPAEQTVQNVHANSGFKFVQDPYAKFATWKLTFFR